MVQNGDTRGGADAWWLAVVVDAAETAQHLKMRPPVGLESGTGLFKTCTSDPQVPPVFEQVSAVLLLLYRYGTQSVWSLFGKVFKRLMC